jgi:hypothetical protein
MDRLLLSHPPLPAAGTDGDLLELDVLWLAAPSTVGLGILVKGKCALGPFLRILVT